MGEVKAELADGEWIVEEVYLGTILVNHQPYMVEMTQTDSETAVMGMAMLLEQEAIFNLHTMTIQVTHLTQSGQKYQFREGATRLPETARTCVRWAGYLKNIGRFNHY